jgi:hypothetical protein
LRHNGGRRCREIRAVMLADSEYVETDLLGELGFLDYLIESPGPRHVRECVQTKLHPLLMHA